MKGNDREARDGGRVRPRHGKHRREKQRRARRMMSIRRRLACEAIDEHVVRPRVREPSPQVAERERRVHRAVVFVAELPVARQADREEREGPDADRQGHDPSRGLLHKPRHYMEPPVLS